MALFLRKSATSLDKHMVEVKVFSQTQVLVLFEPVCEFLVLMAYVSDKGSNEIAHSLQSCLFSHT